MVALRSRDGAISYEVRGEGPALLVPSCNYDWRQIPHFDALSTRFRVIVASPRGFQDSERGSAAELSLDTIVGDLLTVCDEVGVERFAVFGYSLSAAVAAALAGATDRVLAAVLGGFPLLGDYRLVWDRAQRDAEQVAGVPFDVDAVLAVYQRLAALPAGALVTGSAAPLYAFWGAEDSILRSFGVDVRDEASLRGHGATVRVLPELDHDGVLLALDRVLPDAMRWLDEVLPAV